MKNKKISSRVDIVDGLRFVMMLFIMMLHFLFQFGSDPKSMRVRSAYIFVEAFFILTGYLTTRHFQKIKTKNIEEAAKNSLSYTAKKFKSYLPYVVIGVLIGFATNLIFKHQDFNTLLIEFAKLPLEFLYGSSFLAEYHCGPLWYLSAMFIVFPFFCMITQIKKYKKLRNLILIFVSYIFLLSFSHDVFGYLALVRAFCSLLLGILVYEATEWLKGIEFNKRGKITLQIIEVSSILFTFFVVMQHGDFTQAFSQIRFCVLLAFMVFFSIIFSGQTYTSNIKSNFCGFLGKITLPAYLIHEGIVKLMGSMNLDMGFRRKLLIYYSVTILLSIVLYFAVEKLRRREYLKSFFTKKKA